MKRLLILPLVAIMLIFTACPVEKDARDAIAADKAFIDNVAKFHAECNDPQVRATEQVCVLIDRANAIKHVAGRAINLYCASPDYDTVLNAPCNPPTDKASKDQLQNKLNAALRDLAAIIADIKALNPTMHPEAI